MSVAQIIALIQAGQSLVQVGILAVDQINAFVKGLSGKVLTDAEMDLICDQIAVGARAHKALADLDKG